MKRDGANREREGVPKAACTKAWRLEREWGLRIAQDASAGWGGAGTKESLLVWRGRLGVSRS